MRIAWAPYLQGIAVNDPGWTGRLHGLRRVGRSKQTTKQEQEGQGAHVRIEVQQLVKLPQIAHTMLRVSIGQLASPAGIKAGMRDKSVK